MDKLTPLNYKLAQLDVAWCYLKTKKNSFEKTNMITSMHHVPVALYTLHVKLEFFKSVFQIPRYIISAKMNKTLLYVDTEV